MNVDNVIIPMSDLKNRTKAVTRLVPESTMDEFYMIGRGSKMNVLKILMECNRKEQFTIETLMKNRDYRNNLCTIRTNEMTPTQRSEFSQGLSSFKKKNYKIVHRIQKAYKNRPTIYLMNPNFIIPKDYDIVLAKWNNYK